jgi:sporulation integral membrane protein YlbJ
MGYFISSKKKKAGILVLVTAFTAAMVLMPQVTETGSKTAILIWANSIVPVLFPFFIFSDFLRRTLSLSRLPNRIYPLIVAFLSGYPMGAKVVGDLVTHGNLRREEGRWVLSYSLVTGPAFLMGTIGAFLGSSRAAAMVATAHYSSALLNGLLYRSSSRAVAKGGSRYDSSGRAGARSLGTLSSAGSAGSARQADADRYLEHFTASITAGLKAMAMILAYLIVFMIGMNLLEAAGLFRLIGNETVSSMIKGILEMTAGASMVGACNLSMPMKTVLTSFLVSFGGFSVIGQAISMAAGSGIGLSDLVRIKLTHGLLAGILAALLVRALNI